MDMHASGAFERGEPNDNSYFRQFAPVRSPTDVSTPTATAATGDDPRYPKLA